jgi:hypothetical protein
LSRGTDNGDLMAIVPFDSAEVDRTLRLLIEPDGITEIRAFTHGGGISSGYFDSASAVADAFRPFASHYFEGVYCLPSPINRALLARSANRMRRIHRDPTTSDSDIQGRRWLLVDVDPERPAKISSTDAEHEAALALARRIRDGLRERGWPDPVLADSGNGAHILYRINIENDVESAALCQRVLQALDALFLDPIASVDLKTFNAARIWKLYGTPACKGDSTPDRPHRMARLLEVPADVVIVTREQLAAIAAHAPQAEPHRNGTKPASCMDADAWLRGWVREHNVPIESEEPDKIAGGKSRWRLTQCPWNPEHQRVGETIRRAARATGATVTAITKVSLREAGKILEKEEERMQTESRPAHRGVPSYFRAHCETARQGGANGYAEAGYHLAIHLGSESPDELDINEWAETVEEGLHPHLNALEVEEERGRKIICETREGALDAAWKWFLETYPKMMALVPKRHRERFILGVLQAHEEGRTDV